MMSSNQPYRIHWLTALCLTGTVAGLFAWLYVFNRFQVFYYQEQAQLFRFDALYFLACLERPGGLATYAGDFLTQFFYYPALGAAVYVAALASVGWAMYKALEGCGDVGRLFLLPFLPVAALMIPATHIQFRLAYVVGLLTALAAFLLYLRAARARRYAVGAFLLLATYAVAGGNMLALAALMAAEEGLGGKRRAKYVALAALAVVAVGIPLAAWRWLYTVPVATAFEGGTASEAVLSGRAAYALPSWWMPPALYVLWRLGGRAVGGFFRVRPAAALLLSLAGVGGILAHACALRDRTTETILHMYHEIGRGRWEEAIRVREKASPASRHTVYLANIALCEAGRMPYEMFRYAQFGPAGLFLDREVSYFSYTFLGEIYFRLGMMQAAEHCAYESLVAWSQKPTAQTLARLAETTLARGDLAACEKYLRFFERTLFYRQWAGERRALVEALRRDPQTAMGPEPAAVAIPEPFFLNYNAPEAMMRKILEGNPRHRKVFEYLMAYYMLSKDPVSAKTLMDRYYAAFDYPSTPPSFEEALLAYEQATDQPAGYPVSEASRERFRAYLQAARTGAGKAWMEKRYGQTYWYYLYYVQPEALHTSSDSNRY